MKRILAWIGILVFAALYITAIIFAIIGGEYAFPVIMACLFLTVSLSVYLFIGKKVADLLKSRNQKRQQDAREENPPAPHC